MDVRFYVETDSDVICGRATTIPISLSLRVLNVGGKIKSISG
jgi:hypothetical protein